MKASALLTLASVLGTLLLLGSPADAARGRELAVNDPSGLCETCLLSMRFLEDALCDVEAIDFIVDIAKTQLCPAMPDQEECSQLAETLLPVAVEWLRSSATPASLCSAMGVCSATFLGNPAWDKSHARLSDGLACPLCKHVIATVKADAEMTAAVGELVDGSVLRASAQAACRQLPMELAAACNSEFDKRGSLLRLAVGIPASSSGAAASTSSSSASAGRDITEACELLGMCVARLGRFKAPPLPPQLVAELAEARPQLAAAHARLQAVAGAPGTQPALRDSRCDMCKLTVAEVATLLLSPGFQDSLRAYAESACDTTVPPAYSSTCRQYVDAYTPLLFSLLRQYVQPEPVCVRMGMCARPSVWQELLAGLGLRPRGGARGGVLTKVLRANLP